MSTTKSISPTHIACYAEQYCQPLSGRSGLMPALSSVTAVYLAAPLIFNQSLIHDQQQRRGADQ